jgi:hypothetical protein
MSDTTSFLGGAALAGLASIILLRGGLSAGSQTPSQSPVPTPSLPTVPVYPSPISSPSTVGLSTPDYEKQRLEVEQMRSQVEQQRTQIEQLKAQTLSQQTFIETLTGQNKTNNGVSALQARPTNPSAVSSEQSIPAINGLMWVFGGMLLTFGCGLALFGVFVLFARQQQRPSRTIEVIHSDHPAYLNTWRRSEALPPRRPIKRVQAKDFDFE